MQILQILACKGTFEIKTHKFDKYLFWFDKHQANKRTFTSVKCSQKQIYHMPCLED